MIKPVFVVLTLALALPSLAEHADDAFNSVVNDINQEAGKIAAAQQRQSRERKASEALKTGSAAKCTPAQADEAYAALKRCETALKKMNGSGIFDAQGSVITGFAAGRYPGGSGLVLLTTTEAFVYHEDCGVCAAIDRCTLKSGLVQNAITMRGITCDDIAQVARVVKGVVVYSACPLP